jgi:rare lipoprotein A
MRLGSARNKCHARRRRRRALMIAIPVSAVALSAAPALAATGAIDLAGPVPAPTPLQIDVQSRQIPYGYNVVVSGSAPVAAVGDAVALEFTPAGRSGWRQLSTTTVTGTGRFRLAAPLERSGAVKAVESSGGSSAFFLSGGGTTAVTAASSAHPVVVKAALRVVARQIGALTGQPVHVRGRLLPGLPGRRVALQGLRGGAWQTLATTHTGARGRFRLGYAPAGAGEEAIRVRFDGDRSNAHATAGAGRLTAYREAGASWYDDAGSTACGFHAFYGVANRTLPCGTPVKLRYNGRSVTATVDDRGPYVAGRDWDLNQNTAAALGFGGVGTVWSSQ